MVSSWIVSPLAVLVAQGFGVANSPVVIAVLLATGACVPFQLLINECLAVAETKGRLQSTRIQLAMLLAMQFSVCILSVSCLARQNFPLSQIVLIAGLLAVSSGLSYQTSLWYFRLVTTSVASLRVSVIVGAIPGITSLLLYFAYCGISSWQTPFPSEVFIVASTVLPAIVQWGYVQRLSMHFQATPSWPNTESRPAPSTGWLFASVVLLTFLVVGSTRLREEIAVFSADYVALVLVVLNSMLSLINTITRATFLSRPGNMHRKPLTWLVIGVAAFSVSTFAFGSSSAFLLFTLLGTQLAVAWVIGITQNIIISTC
jgi:hypothetical protein